MRRGLLTWILLCLLCGVGAWFLLRPGNHSVQRKPAAAPSATRPASAATRVSSGVISTNPAQISRAEWGSNKFAGRLSNTTRPIGRLVNDSHAILLANALIDTTEPLNFGFPKNLQPQGDPGAYIVQARGPIDQPFRAMLAQAGAAIVSYIPNDAYLVRASSSVANTLQVNSLVQAVVPYEPYYKIQSALLYPAVNEIQLADGEALNLGLFADNAQATISQIEKLGGQVIGNGQSPFGPVVRVIPPKNWTALATLPGVQIVEPFRSRAAANDLSRAADGVAADSLTATNYLGLTGTNIVVEVNDTGIDKNHPDLTAGGNYNKVLGVIGDAPQSLVDTDGHGTHVAGIIAGDGAESTTVTNAPGSTLPGGQGTNYQFRGMAPGATLYSVAGIEGGADTNVITDQYLQETPARTNALISNNSWVYEGDSFYDLAAASYDAAVRDALPLVTGSQPVLFVFAAGNAGDGSDSQDIGVGAADSIESPATAKDVIAVGAIQEQRSITNSVKTVTLNPDGTYTTNTSQPWQAETSTGYRVAGFSSRGNTGIGIEGTYGRYKPDVVAPGTFTISTRSGQWDIKSYFYQDPTNDLSGTFSGLVIQPGSAFNNSFPNVPSNAVQVAIYVYPGADSPVPFPFLPVFVGLSTTSPDYDFIGANDPLLIPGDPNAPGNYLQQIINSEVVNPFVGFYYAISNNTVNPISINLETDIYTTNGTGDYYLVLSNLDNSIGQWNNSPVTGPYYRYETGTSMSAADVSGVLALMQQFYFNAYGVTPSPAMLKAMLINGAQVTSSAYNYQVQNSRNYEGWGLVNLQGSLPTGITNQLGISCSTYVQDQNPTNALATGDSQTFYVNMSSPAPLRATLAWTDPPGDPAAAIKLVNNLVVIVTNYISGFSNPTNAVIYYGNDFPAGNYNNAHGTNTAPVYDSINNVQTVNLQQGGGTNFSVTVLGYRVNVNAVTAQTNTYAVNGPPGTYAPNVVQDFALVISSGATNDMTVSSTPAPSAGPPVTISNPTGDQQVTVVSQTAVGSGISATTYAILQNQFAGANTPLLGNNTILFPPGTNGFGPNNWQVTVGMTNQWHFYVVTNANSYSNGAFIVFNPNAPEPDTLSVPRMGVFADTTANSSRDADIDLYVSTDPSLTNLNPAAISNAVVLGQVGGPAGANFAGASLGRGSSEFVADTNAELPRSQVYYVGVKSEDQESAEYGFIAIFTQTPFSQNQNGTQVVNGVPVPTDIPDGSSKVPGKAYIFGLALFPMQVAQVTVTNEIWHQRFGDLIGTLTLSDGHADVLNNHDSFGSPPSPPGFPLIYDDSPGGGIPGSRPSDGPGSLNDYIGQQAMGVWMLTEADTALTQTGTVYSYELTIQPHQDLGLGITNTLQPNSWFYDYIDVPPGATNLTVYGTNVSPTVGPQPLELFIKYGSEPTTNSYDAMTNLDSGNPPGNSISIGPPLKSGRYFVGVYNPNNSAQAVYLLATIGLGTAPVTIYNSTDTPKPILDDAVTTDSISVTNYAIISSLDVALAVQHPRISDLVFHLISPDGTRELLMENRGGTDPNGAGGITTIITNNVLTSDFDAVGAGDYNINQNVAGWYVAGGEVSVETDPTNAYGGKNNYLALADGTLFTNLPTTPGTTYTFTFAYRGPGIVGWWRGEGNANDSAYGNNGTMVGPSSEAYYTNNGEVGSAFTINEPSYYPYAGVQVPDISAYWLTNSLSIEGWIRPSGDGWLIFWRGDNRPGIDPYWLGMEESTQIGFGIGDNAGGGASIFYTGVPYHTWHHVAATLNGSTGSMKLYVDGNQVTQTTTTERPFGQLIPGDHPGVGIGNVNDGFNNFGYYGDIDEISLYNRALSPSEIQAIFSYGQGLNPKGGNGKFDPNVINTNALQSLAEAQVSVNGSITNTIFGNNTNWQTSTITFTATSSLTPVQIQGIEPGMLLGNASVAAVITNYAYLVFTENTNNTTTPIKFAIPPFLPGTPSTNAAASGFESPVTATDYAAGNTINDGTNVWNVLNNQVSVVNDSSNADAGNQFLALANGTISSTLPTVAGRAYVLTFRYRGPGIAGWWRGEGNTLDSSGYGNTGYWYNGIGGYTSGEVGTTFSMNGVNQFVIVNPPSGSWNPGMTNGFTFEGWINPATTTAGLVLMEFERALGTGSGSDVGVGLGYDNVGTGSLLANVKDAGGGDHVFNTGAGVVTNNSWQHIALTYNRASGFAAIYYNGGIVAQANPGSFLPDTSFTNLMIGGRTTFINPNAVFTGGMDEMSMYNRALSDSEIQAIYDDGTNGKFDPGVAIPQSLAEAQVSVNGGTPSTFYGNNMAWQTRTIVFTATQNGTPLQITGVEPGMLLDSFSLAQLAGDTYYLPEQSLDDAFDGENAHGLWTLEIQDDRAGATNPLPVLENWQLRFNFVTYGTNIYPAVPLTLPQLPEQIAVANQPFTVTNAAFGGAPPYIYTLTSTVTNGPTPAIDTNGVITWTPNANQASAVYIFTNIVTDTTGLMATDIFPVIVVLNIGQPAFPGAEGPGGAAIGGRGGDVYHVINVNDGGPGSLRYGITNTSGNRTIVFDVGGTINLQTNLVITDPYLTIAGQTAPGDGITLNGFTASVQDAHDDVLRFLRFRPGDINSPAFQGDSFHFLRVTNSIADHISASWSINEALSTTYSTNISVQWSIIADPLNHSAHYMDDLSPGFEAHGDGSLLRYGSGAIGYHHDLYADNYSYNPRPGDNIQLDFINNVVFNWGIAAGVNADDTANNPNGYTNFLNYAGNYFIAGSNTTANPNIAFQANVPNAADTQIYQSTNYIDNNAGTNLLNGIDTGFGMFSGAFTQLGAATTLPGIPITSTNPPQAYEQVLAFAGNTMAGASAAGDYLLRDPVDTNIVTGVRGKSGRIIDFISSNRFSGVYLNTSSEATYSGFTVAGSYWQSHGVTNFTGVNPWPVLDSAPQPSDSDGDGIPDYWEITLAALGQASMNPAVPNNNHLNPDGYTDLEHYINWLAAPHALTVSNTPVNVDLDAIVGRTGNWGFAVTNPVNGTVTLTNYTATFTPTNGVIGFASFDFSATNLVTSNDFDVTVSVFVSVTNITYSSVVLSNAKSASNSATNPVPANSIFKYLVKVPTNALFATNRILSASGPVNLLFSGVGFPTGTNIGDYTLLTGSTSGSSVLSTTSVPTNIVQGGTYYLGVQNNSGTPVNVGVEVDFCLLQTSISGPTITSTNINGTNGFLLQWSGPTNYDYTIQWKTNLAPAVPWNSVANPVINATFTPAGGYYSWFDDGSLAGGFPPIKFYRVVAGTISGPITTSSPTVTNVIVAGTVTPLTVSVPANAAAATNVLVSATGPINVWFSQTTPFTGGTNAGDVLMLSNVTGGSFLLNSSSTPPLVPGADYYLGLQNTGTNDITSVFQVTFAYAPPPPSNAPTITTITLTNIGGTNGILLTWFAPTNYRYQVQWTTNLLPGSWQTIPGVVLTNLSTFAPTNGIGAFQYLDDGTWTGGFGVQKFYRLIAWPPGATIPPSLVITSVKAVPGGVQIQWGGSTNYVYDMAWTTNLGLPTASWNVISNLNAPTLIYSGGVFTFTDTNVFTPEFFRVLLLP